MRFAAAPIALLLSACTPALELPQGASWDPDTGVFQWRAGQLTLPQGMKYARVENDTFAGEFVSSNGKTVVHHDIGAAAGAWAQNVNARLFEEKMVEGARVWISQRLRGGEGDAEVLVAVTFPDNDCANFFMLSQSVLNAAVIQKLAATFQPRNTTKAAETCEQRAAGPVQ